MLIIENLLIVYTVNLLDKHRSIKLFKEKKSLDRSWLISTGLQI